MEIGKWKMTLRGEPHVIRSAFHRCEPLPDYRFAKHHLCSSVIRSCRRDHVLFNHRAAQIVCAVVQTLPPDIQALSQPRRLHVWNVSEIESPDREPPQVLITRNAIRKPLADRRVVWLKRPRNE